MGKILSQGIFALSSMPKKIPQPIIRSINRTANHIIVIASREVTKHYTIKQRDAKSMMKITKKSSNGNFETIIKAESRLLTPYHFKYTPTTAITVKKGTGWKNYLKRPKTNVTIKKSNKETLNHAFVAVVRGQRNVFIREDKKLISFRSVSLPQMVSNPKVANVISEDMAEYYEKQFIHEFNFIAERLGFK